jgi:hypothetical protein
MYSEARIYRDRDMTLELAISFMVEETWIRIKKFLDV